MNHDQAKNKYFKIQMFKKNMMISKFSMILNVKLLDFDWNRG
jgi:hypothetical protein